MAIKGAHVTRLQNGDNPMPTMYDNPPPTIVAHEHHTPAAYILFNAKLTSLSLESVSFLFIIREVNIPKGMAPQSGESHRGAAKAV
mmetsp:Transcript_12069/g.24660  ORF Transcript_12069/g.24660 Transcript_12069/m.24660 type:complete len:86 (-) Transcript_12069:169-426(-)